MKVSTAAVITVCVIVVIALAALSGFLFWQNNKLKHQKTKTADASMTDSDKKLVESVVEKVGKLYELPKDETPSLATVNDVSQLKGQPFFDLAENGDRVVVYAKHKFAILYRESKNKIINVGPVEVSKEGQSATQSVSQ